jgi:hypothetical protein
VLFLWWLFGPAFSEESENETEIVDSENETEIAASETDTDLDASENETELVESATETEILGEQEMGVFHLKYRDTRRPLDVTLRLPDQSLPDLTGSTVKLHIWLSDGTKLERDMSIVGAPANAQVRYTWVATDWDAGGLVVGPSLPLAKGQNEHRFEIETINGAARETFPNARYDTLRIITDIGQGTP